MMIPDLSRATAADIDLDMVERKLWNIRRFQGHPDALCVRPHTLLVQHLAIRDDAIEPVVEWCLYHDDHESLIGDINGLVVNQINKETDYLSALANHLDRCICEARGIAYPTLSIRKQVHFYDKLAESLECKFGLGWPPFKGNPHPAWPDWLDHGAAKRIYDAHACLSGP